MWNFRFDHFMVSYLNLFKPDIFIFTGLAIWISSRLPSSQVSTRNSSPLALTTILSSLSSSTVIVTSWNSVPSKVFWAVQITSKWFELEFPYHSIIIIATTACSTILLTWSSIKIISVNSMYTLITILLWSILIFMLQNINFQIFSVTSTFLKSRYSLLNCSALYTLSVRVAVSCLL